MKPLLVLALSSALLAGCATSAPHAAPPAGAPLVQDAKSSTAQSQTPPAEAEESHGVGHHLLWYIPNRISDILDIVRLRVRLGPGFQLGVRATELLDLNLGGYTSVFVGIPGPRRERSFNWPFGLESMSGVELSVMDTTDFDGDKKPHYGVLEIGLGAQLLILGADVGVDVWEVVDFATGLIFIDPVADDI